MSEKCASCRQPAIIMDMASKYPLCPVHALILMARDAAATVERFGLVVARERWLTMADELAERYGELVERKEPGE